MFGRDHSMKRRVEDTVGYVDPLTNDEKLRERLAAAIVAGAGAGQRIREQTGLVGLARRLADDPVLRAQLVEMATAVQAAKKRAKKAGGHRLRNTILIAGGAGLVIAAVPRVRDRVMSLARVGRDQWAPSEWSDSSTTQPVTIEEVIEVAVPVSTVYNQWTQFEEFPRFMAGVDEVRQLDDTLLHWAATVAGKHAEWDAKIIEQEPDKRISWKSISGAPNAGTVRFEAMGPGVTKIRLVMAYAPQGAIESAGDALGIFSARVQHTIEDFKHYIESRTEESGGWRGAVARSERAQ